MTKRTDFDDNEVALINEVYSANLANDRLNIENEELRRENIDLKERAEELQKIVAHYEARIDRLRYKLDEMTNDFENSEDRVATLEAEMTDWVFDRDEVLNLLRIIDEAGYQIGSETHNLRNKVFEVGRLL
jgi:chromosome segregation ATPase